jgi:glycosyltransferase involved in cell wall biosynthesis
MKILFFSHQAEFLYGGEIVTLEFLRELKARGVDTHFASPAGPYQERARAGGARVHTVASRQFRRSLPQLPGIVASFSRARGELREIAAREGVSVLHATSLKAMAYAWGLGVPTIWHHHDILPPGFANSLWLRGLASRAARILAPSEATRAALLAAGVSAARVKVLRNGFRLEEWKARPAHKPGLFRIGLVGEISHRKGTDRLEGLLAALGEDPLLQVLVIGEGLSERAFAETLKAKLASRRVRFLGRRERMKELYQEMDVLFVPSRQDPLPTVIVEAGLSGVPVVGARAGGIPEMIVDGENGFLFDTESEAAAGVSRIRADWTAFSTRSRAVAEARYDIGKLTEELLGHYREVGDA